MGAEAMGNDTETTLDLQSRIGARKAQVNRYLMKARPRKRLLINTSIVGGSLAALLTAGPALGGKSFTDWITGITGLESPAWRLLCGAAALSSFLATVSIQILKSNGLEENLAKAQICSAKLEILELGLSSGQMDEKGALAEYIRCIEETAFLVGEGNA